MSGIAMARASWGVLREDRKLMIFPAVWNLLPGPRWVRAILLAAALAGIIWVLFEYVFPWVSVTFGIQDQNVGDA